MAEIIVRNEQDKAQAIRRIQSMPAPCVLSLKKGKPRTVLQNKLQRKWILELQEQGDQTAEEYRAFCKLHFGVPMLRNESDEFREKYDRIIKPMPYEQKLELMAEPFDFSVTRLMTTVQKKRYLDTIYHHFVGQGFFLTDPDMRGLDAQGRPV